MSDEASRKQTSEGHSPQGQQGASKGKRRPKGKQQTIPRGQSSPQQSQGDKDQNKQQDQAAQSPPSAEGGPQKTKAQLRAERRALQEAQRAAKAAAKQAAVGGSGQKNKEQQKDGGKKPVQGQQDKNVKQVPVSAVKNEEKTFKESDKNAKLMLKKAAEKEEREAGFFAHLQQYEHNLSLTSDRKYIGVHPAILKLGLQYANGVICGSNARCIALLASLKQVISDYTTPPDKEMSRDLDLKLEKDINFLTKCRPLSVNMFKAVKHVKSEINELPHGMTDSKAKAQLYSSIDTYKDNILLAGTAIAKILIEDNKITDGDVILVYAYSSLIRDVLCKAHECGKQFSVIVVDGRPKLEGREMLRKLVKHGIKCSYVLINAASYVMREVTKVLLGAHALLANGYVMSRVGSSQVALIARSYNVPVLVCCDTYKFSEKVQMDSFVFNELGNPDDLARIGQKQPYLEGWREKKNLHLLNFVYDVTPSDLISMVITELGMVPCTSVPVVLRIKQL